MKNIFRKLIYGYKADSNSCIKHLKEAGVKIGDDVIIYAPKNIYRYSIPLDDNHWQSCAYY